ncbi:YadA-like family protein [Photobacterium sp. BZF1]|nr:YadA-like family protein [Photobacterium sp. BZF1]
MGNGDIMVKGDHEYREIGNVKNGVIRNSKGDVVGTAFKQEDGSYKIHYSKKVDGKGSAKVHVGNDGSVTTAEMDNELPNQGKLPSNEIEAPKLGGSEDSPIQDPGSEDSEISNDSGNKINGKVDDNRDAIKSIGGRVIKAEDNIVSNTSRIEENSERIDTLEQDLFNFQTQAEQQLRELDDRLDMTNASLHAVTNARPMVASGQTAFGAGVGFAGGAEAVAVGVAHSFEDSNWSASATMNYANGDYSNDFSAGAGVQYAF